MLKTIISTTLCLLVCGIATAAPEVTYCFQEYWDSNCSLGDSETTATLRENLYFEIVDVTAKSNIGDPQIDNWCAIKANFDEVGVTAPYPQVLLYHRGGTPDADSGYKGVSDDHGQREHLFYLKDSASDNSIVDGTTNETDLGTLRIRGAYFASYPNWPAPCSDGTVSLVPNETSRPMGISETYDGETWSCGGVDPSDGVSVSEVLAHVSDWDIDQPTTLTVTIIADEDNDFAHNSEDNCVYLSNVAQTDTNNDGYGNMCDCDFDNNGSCGITDFGVISQAYGCTVELGRCTMPGWSGQSCTLDDDQCPIGVCTDCYDKDIDMDSNGGIGISDWALYFAGHGKSMVDRGLDLCE